MCLSTVYNNSYAPENLFCKNVMDVHFCDGKLVFTNILGIQTVVDASLEKIDLTDNYIIIRKNES